MAIDPNTTDTVSIPQLDPISPLSIATYLVGSNVDGQMGRFTVEELTDLIAPIVAALGASSYIATTGTVLSNPTAKPTAFTFVGIGTFTQTTGGSVTTTAPLNLLSWNGTTWSLTLAIPIDLTNYLNKTDYPNITGLEARFVTSKNKFNKDGIINEGFYLNTGGTPAAEAQSSYSDYIPVTAGNIMTVSGLTYVINTGFVVVFYNSAKVKLSQLSGSANTTHTIPVGGAFVRFNTRFTQAVPSYGTIQYEIGAVATSYAPYSNKISKDAVEQPDLIDKSVTPAKTSFFVNRANLFDKNTMVTYDFLLNNGDGTPASSVGWAYATIPINAANGNIIITKGLSNVSTGDDTLHFFNASNVRVGTSSFLTAAIPATAVTLRMNVSNTAAKRQLSNDTFMVEYGTTTVGTYVPYTTKNFIPPVYMVDESIVVAGKLVSFVGDSIVKADGYIGYIQTLNKQINIAYENRGDNGATITNTYPTYSTISGALLKFNFIPTTDMVLFGAGTNDYGHNNPIGTIADGIAGIDTTVKGALYMAIKWVKDNYPACKIGFLIPIERSTDAPNSLGLKLIDYRNAIIDVCNYWAVPYLDLFYNNVISQSTAAKYLYDGLHPNNGGYVVLSDSIKPWLINILAK